MSGITINSRVNNVLTAVDEYSSHIYRPKTAETEVKYAELLALISKYYPDESGVRFCIHFVMHRTSLRILRTRC